MCLLQDLLDSSSSVLHSALGVYYAAATVVVPAAWKDGSCGVNIRTPDTATPFAAADIVVDKSVLMTSQSGGCAAPGDVITLPHTFIVHQNLTQSHARAFVHEWAKFRYGIFDQVGFAGDNLYPSFYIRDGKPLPTVTHDGVLAGSWLRDGEPCSPEQEERCRYAPDPASEVSCSLGSRLGLSSVRRYCNGSEAALRPTKHAVLCHGRSAADVISSHADFATLRPVSQPPNDLKPEIRIVREPPTKYVLAIDTSSSMNDHWRWIHKAAHKFIRYDLPVNSNLAILTFNDKAKLEHPLVQVIGIHISVWML